ncbi:Oidioi.mRNA.OKI2018_I69.PAR.g8820.t1.cds [Oikopleura dioica]|uniref:Oidioi.mRNA.OKI2018_I69.PAR.g8820.t1.cds n=1 Tax=Oikopleura dioica TaxID=34765 RepID=A0ABN7RM08_OIKDI|nr:Oidioi.mRNA.OKI2018_I69.PAR.g8820.t1.cds [Oikopleura dioica]
MKLSAAFFIASVAADCYDGNNGGCSHFCDSGVCSCPACWTLDSDSMTCIIETGRASVTCSTTGSEVRVDKCVFPGVADTGLSLADPTCTAIEDPLDNTKWLLQSGSVDGCGATMAYSAPDFTFSNTLAAAAGEVNGIITDRPVSVDFSCLYEGETSVSSAIKVDNPAVVTSFDINDVQSTAVPLAFNMDFYTANDYATVADLSTISTAVGNPIYGELTPVSAIPGTDFVTTYCSVTDGSSTLEVLNVCPNAIVDFQFGFSGQSDAAAIQFQFNSFLFPNATSGTYTMSCDVKVCESADSSCLAGC